MEILRQKNQNTTIVFPLIEASNNNYYTTSAWAALTNKSVSAYSWNDSGSTPNVASIAGTPTQLAATGLWSLSASSSEMNPNSGNDDYLAIKLKADQIKEQTVLVILTDYSTQSLADTSNKIVAGVVPKVTVSANEDKAGYALSGTKNILDDLNDIDGTAVTATSVTDKTDYSISGTKKLLDDLNDIDGSSVTATSVTDKIDYSISGTKKLLDDLNDIDGSSVTATSVTDKTDYSISGTKKLLDDLNDIDGSAVTATSVTDKTDYSISGTKKLLDNLNDIDGSSVTATSIPAITIGEVTVSAYNNFPQVTVSANLDKTNYSVSGLTSNAVGNIWDEMNSGHVISGSTGYNVSLLPNINTNVGVAVAGVPSNFLATADELVNGTRTAGSYSATWYDNGQYFQITTSGTSALDVNLTFELGTTRISQVTINGRFEAGPARFVNVFAYDYTTSAYSQISDSITRMINSTSDLNYTFNLLPQNRSSTGEVKIRFLAGQTNVGDNLYLDQVLVKGVAAGATPEDIANAVYNKMSYTVYDGKVWIDTTNGVSGTDVGINGIPTNPVNNLADAITIATELGVNDFYIFSKSNITLTQTFDGWVFEGQEYDINLNGQECTDTIFDFAEVNGLATCQPTKDIHFNDCYIENISANNTSMRNCQLLGTIVITSGNHVWDRCIDGTDSLSTPIVEFQDSSTLQIRKYSGGLQLNNMTSANDVIIDGAGRIIIDSSCTGGTVTIRGFFSLTNNGTGLTITQDSRYNVSQAVGSVTAPITVSAYQNFPQVYVSANGDKTNYSISANSDKTGYSVISVPKVTVSANEDKTGYSVISIPQAQISGVNNGLYIGTSAYINFPSVNVSSVDANAITSGDLDSDYWNKIDSLTDVNREAVRVSAIDGGLFVGTSAYINFPQVIVSANLDKADYGISGTKKSLDALNDIDGSSVTATSIPEVTVSAFNVVFPKVTVSANEDKTGYSVISVPKVQVSGVDVGIEISATVTIDYEQIKDASVSAIDERFTFSGTDVQAYTTNMISIGSVNVSSIDSDVRVHVSANDDKTDYTVSAGSIDRILEQMNVNVSSVDNDVYFEVTAIPRVYVSGIDSSVVLTITSGLATSTDVTNAQTALTNLINALNDLSEAEIRTLIGLNATSAIDELSAAPTNPTVAQAIMLGYMQRRNKMVTNSSTSVVETYNNADTKVFESAISDDGTIFTKAKLSYYEF